MKGANIRTSVRITFEEAVFGIEKELELTLKDECASCHGSGAKPERVPKPARSAAARDRSYLHSNPFLARLGMYRPARNVTERAK